jgi:carbon-monoxide dehydrogenase large subunit
MVEALARPIISRSKSEAPARIGAPQPRAHARVLAEGRGRYLDDIHLDRMAHVAFLRSPHAHARLICVETDNARAAPGVIAVFTGRDLADVCLPFETRLKGVPHHKSPPQYPLVLEEACWQGEAVVAVVADERGLAEDAVELIELEWEVLKAVTSMDLAIALGGPTVHTALPDNLAMLFNKEHGDLAAAFAAATHIVEAEFAFERQTGAPLEPRGLIASFDARLGELTVHQSHQAPWQMREVFATQLGLAPEAVRVIIPDVGGAFGTKLAAYADELAVAAISVKLGRPVKYVCDRLEAFASDAHAREAKATARMAVSQEGQILAFDVAVVSGFGAYSAYPRGSTGEAVQAAQMVGAPYQFSAFRGRARGVLQNKAPTAPYRGVGQPIACAITEELVDRGAAAAGIDPVAFRRLNYRKTLPGGRAETEAGLFIEELSLERCLDGVVSLMNYDQLRAEQAELRKKGRYRGIGFGSFVELTGVGSGLYGRLGVNVSAEESCRLTLEPSGCIRCETSVTDQGQGTTWSLAQIIAETFDLPASAVKVITGDTSRIPYGGGAWASRGIALGGEAARLAAIQLRDNVFAIAAAMLQCVAPDLTLQKGVVLGLDKQPTLSLSEVASTVIYRRHEVPLSQIPPLTISESFSPSGIPYLASNGVQAALVEVDVETGQVDVIGFWIVDDCGRVVNPLMVDEQLRGGVVQGIGAALFEECVYEDGQLTNGTMADYLLPMASEMPDILVGHVRTPTRMTGLGAKGVGEAGTVGAPAAIRSALSDALSPFGARVVKQPFTPARILASLMASGH